MSLDAALALARHGWRVFPVAERGKEPMVRWREWATTDAEKIVVEWAGRAFNVGIACGESGLLVVDEDSPDGFGKFAASIGQSAPVTYTVTTGRPGGGRHFYFAAPAGVELGNSRALKEEFGCDVRGNGGYVVAAGSTHESGAIYAANEMPLAPCPDWLINALLVPKSTPAPSSIAMAPPPPIGGLDAVPDVIRGPHHDAPGERHDVLMRYAGSLRGRKVPWAEARILLGVAWRRCEQPPDCVEAMPWPEAEALLADVYSRYPAGQSGLDYAVPADADPHTQAVYVEAEKLRVREAARSLVSAEKADVLSLPSPWRLDLFLAQPDPVVAYRVQTLMPAEARVLLAAQHKAGKTTLVANLIRALVDGEMFLGTFAVRQARRVVLIDNELSEKMLRTWLREQGIVNADRVELISLRGRVSTFDLLDEAMRARWAKAIGRADVLILDCLRPALDALGLSEDKDAGRFLVAFDTLLAEAGIAETIVVHHMGHVGERARGDSRLLDWPDALWRLVRDKDDGNEVDVNVNAPRYLTAYGRDVDLGETLLAFDPVTRRLTVAGGSRRDVKRDAALADLISYLTDQDEPLSANKIENAPELRRHPRDTRRDALKDGVLAGKILVQDGERNAKLHFLNPSVRGFAGPRGQFAGEQAGHLASSPLDGAANSEANSHGSTSPDRQDGEVEDKAACIECGTTDDLLYFETEAAWRCQRHPGPEFV